MKFSLNKASSVLSVSTLALLTACGGGGGGGSEGDSSVPTQGNSSITVQNAPVVAYEVANAMGALEMSGGESYEALSADAKTAGLIDISTQHLRQALSNKSGNLGVGAAATESETINCPGGGTISAVINYSNSQAISNGDTVSITYNNCKYGDGMLTGGYKVTFVSVNGPIYTSSAWSMTTKTEFKAFSIQTPTYSSSINGGSTFAYQQASDSDYKYSVSGNSLQVSGTEDGISSSLAFSSFKNSGEEANALLTYRTNFTVFGKSSKLSDDVSYVVKTIKDFKANDAYPHEGELVITATNKSTLRFTVLDNTKVQIAVDSDGNGTVDNTKTMTWTEFYNQ